MAGAGAKGGGSLPPISECVFTLANAIKGNRDYLFVCDILLAQRRHNYHSPKESLENALNC